MESVNIGGKTYDIDGLTDKSKAHLFSLQSTDQKIAQLESDIAMLQTARNVYANGLADQLPEPAHPNKKKDIVTINDKKYSYDDFSDEAMVQVRNVAACDKELTQSKARLAMAKTARQAYAEVLKNELTESTTKQ